MNQKPVLIWFRHDLRLADNPALTEAVLLNKSIIPIFIWSPDEEDLGVGAASRWWLYHSLFALEKSLANKNSKLIIRSGDSLRELETLIKETDASHVIWNRRYEPATIARDTRIKTALTKQNIETKSFKAHLLYEPWQLRTNEGKPYQVYTRFWDKSQMLPPPSIPFAEPDHLQSPQEWPTSESLDSLQLLPKINWADEFKKTWVPGERGAQKELSRFLERPLNEYDKARNIPAVVGTSRLSPHLHFGEISPRQIWQAVQKKTTRANQVGRFRGAEVYLKEIVWREFAHHLIYEFPQTVNQPLRANFKNFPWQKNKTLLRAWQKGMTGYPIVDAGMRELWTTGWMHNRVRMVVASFFVKHLRLSWTEGAAWFWDTLVDADLANNTLGWQWSAGCGADAAPYFRIFNPVLQGEKFDGDGIYVRRWIPELKNIPNKWIHKPWEAPAVVLEKANVILGKNYPMPIVDHKTARDAALTAFQKIKK